MSSRALGITVPLHAFSVLIHAFSVLIQYLPANHYIFLYTSHIGRLSSLEGSFFWRYWLWLVTRKCTLHMVCALVVSGGNV